MNKNKNATDAAGSAAPPCSALPRLYPDWLMDAWRPGWRSIGENMFEEQRRQNEQLKREGKWPVAEAYL